MPGDKTEAELQLQRKYQLLKQKKFQQQQQQKAGAGKPAAPSAAGSNAPKVDPTRLAAIEALKRKRAAEAAAKSEAPPPEASSSPAAAPEPSSKPTSGLKIKLGGGFKIPKRQTEHTTAQATTAATKPPPAPAAAAAPKPAADAAKPEQKGPLKRPALRRPVMARPSAADDEHAAKRPQLDQAQQAHYDVAPEQNSVPGYPGAPSIPQLWVGNLPPEWASADLHDFFGRFHDVAKAHVVPDMCYGFVTFGSYEDAAAVLEFQQCQPVQVHDRELSIHWAMEGSADGRIGGGGGGGQSKIAAARAAAAQVAEQIDHYALAEVNLAGPPPARNLVSYDDL